MIKYNKKVIYYNKNKYMDEVTILKKEFYTLEDALLFLDVDGLKYYINNKSITAVEEVNILYTTDSGIKRLYKK